MLKFHIPHSDGEIIDARLLHTGDDSLSLELNGIEVLYIESDTGNLVFTVLDRGERGQLEAAGLNFFEPNVLAHG